MHYELIKSVEMRNGIPIQNSSHYLQINYDNAKKITLRLVLYFLPQDLHCETISETHWLETYKEFRQLLYYV